MSSTTVTNLYGHRLKKFEKEIRRFLHKNACPEGSAFNAYIFKTMVDKIYNMGEGLFEEQFPAVALYSRIFTLRNLKTDTYIPKHNDEYKDFLELINNYTCFTLHIYNHKFLHKPENAYCRIVCAINKNKKNIIPIQFSANLSIDYPRWFNVNLVKYNKIDGIINSDLIEGIEMALS